MTYTYENAKKICSSYNHLIGKQLHENPIPGEEDVESAITDICVIPVDIQQLEDFFEYYKTETAQNALLLSGFNADEVRIVAIFEQTLTAPSLMLDLDVYLTKKNMEKKYDNGGIYINS